MPATRALLAIAAVAGLAGQAAPPPAPVALRFHHLHYAVEDPGAALGEAVERLGGARTIVQGLGVGVQVGKEYVLFERAAPATAGAMKADVAAVYADAVAWLRQRGLAVAPAAFAGTGIRGGMPSARLVHVAFAADDLAAAVARVGITAANVTGDAARFVAPSGIVVEIVRDTDRPDTHWCPMHLDVRAASPASCPICGMPLVPIPPPRIGEYRLDVDVRPRAAGGASGLRLTVRDPESGEPVTSFIDLHERPFHLFILGRDLESFEHLHPERQEDGSFFLTHSLPPGAFTLVADFLPAAGTPQLVQRAIATPGYDGPLFAAPKRLEMLPFEQVVDGLRVRLETPRLAPRRESELKFVVADAVTGRPVTDLEPFLGAAGHLLIVNAAATSALHGHPEGGFTGGPDVSFQPVFPAPGRYKLWVQLQRRGAIVTAPFVVEIPS